MSSRVFWDGIVEKRGHDFFSRWNRRKMVLVGDECRYFDLPDGDNLKGTIKLCPNSDLAENGSIILIKNVGRPEKKRGKFLMIYSIFLLTHFSSDGYKEVVDVRIQDPEKRGACLLYTSDAADE